MRALFHALVAGLGMALGLAGAALADCRPDALDLRGAWGNARFAVELADTPATRAQGLMFRESMPRFSGMFFVFERPESVRFWMENTLIPLDMLFADATGTVQRIHHDARPLDRTSIPGGDNIQYVLEINAGMSRRLGIVEGSEIRHPSIDTALAAWPCD
jgi:uncharacterized membrane protein (UPF0127 family)